MKQCIIKITGEANTEIRFLYNGILTYSTLRNELDKRFVKKIKAGKPLCLVIRTHMDGIRRQIAEHSVYADYNCRENQSAQKIDCGLKTNAAVKNITAVLCKQEECGIEYRLDVDVQLKNDGSITEPNPIPVVFYVTQNGIVHMTGKDYYDKNHQTPDYECFEETKRPKAVYNYTNEIRDALSKCSHKTYDFRYALLGTICGVKELQNLVTDMAEQGFALYLLYDKCKNLNKSEYFETLQPLCEELKAKGQLICKEN